MIPHEADRFTGLIRSYGIVDAEAQDMMRSIFFPLSVYKNDHFQEIGNTHDRVGIVYKGIFRFYYLDYKGRERTKHLVTDGGFLMSITSLTTDEKLAFSIQAIVDSEIYYTPVSLFRDAIRISSGLNAVFNAHLLKMYILKERRERSLLMKSPEERYAEFLSENYAMCGAISQKYIASYLGVDPVSLSRIRARKRTN